MHPKKLRVAILCGGRSGEHEVSLRSARSIVDAIDRNRFEPTIIGIDKEGGWHLLESETFRALTDISLPTLDQRGEPITLTPVPGGERWVTRGSAAGLEEIDVVFPVLHGTFGEDGCVQGLFELAEIPYVGAGVLGSAVGMDKDIQKRLLRGAGIPIVPFVTTSRHALERDRAGEIARIRELGLPLFVKPANLGSSVGVSKVSQWSDLEPAIRLAGEFDTKIIVERGIDARELECAVLGNDEPRASIVGEICANADFYSYAAKYVDEDGATLLIPAPLSPEESDRIRALALRVFAELDCAGMARVDCFLERDSGALYVNEINTLPGFTSISMYPKLWQATGLSYPDLITRLIELAVERGHERRSLRRSFD